MPRPDRCPGRRHNRSRRRCSCLAPASRESPIPVDWSARCRFAESAMPGCRPANHRSRRRGRRRNHAIPGPDRPRHSGTPLEASEGPIARRISVLDCEPWMINPPMRTFWPVPTFIRVEMFARWLAEPPGGGVGVAVGVAGVGVGVGVGPGERRRDIGRRRCHRPKALPGCRRSNSSPR